MQLQVYPILQVKVYTSPSPEILPMSKCHPEAIVFASLVQSGFLPLKWATVDRNQSRTDQDIVGTKLDHLGLVFCSPWN